MGGNGQFNGRAALDDVADAQAGSPWRDRLTEDQDLGLRIIEAGWPGVVGCSVTTVDQQGLPGLKCLFRQRTRWAQGIFQAMSHLARCRGRSYRGLLRIDLSATSSSLRSRGSSGSPFR